MTSPGGESRTVTVRMLAQIAGYLTPMKQAIQVTKDLRTEMTAAARAGKLDELAGGLTRVGLAAAAGFGVAIMTMAKFDKQMSEVEAVAGATTDQLQQLRDAAREAGQTTAWSATQAAQAEAELAKAGVSAAEIVGGALTGALSLATAGSLDLAEAADVAAKTMNIFGLAGSDVEHIADVLAAAANKSATDVHELGFALRMGGLAAKNAGLSLEETVGTFAAFADNALVGSDAGTSFKTMLQFLAAPTSQARDLMKDLNIQAYDAQGNFVGLEKFAANLRRSLGGLTQEQRNAALATIFGADAMRAATVLFNEGGTGIREYTRAVNDQGAASDVAAKKMDNLAGDVTILRAKLEGLFITSGEGANGGLRMLVQVLGGAVDLVSNLPAPLLTAGTVIIGVTGVVALGTVGWIKYQQATATAITTLKAMGPAGATAAVGLRAVTASLGWVAAALTVATLAWDAFENKTSMVGDMVAQALEMVDERATEMVKSGHAADAIRAVTKLAHEQGMTYNEMVARLPGFAQALRDAADATAEQGQEAQDATVYTLALGGAFGNAASQVDGLREAFDRLNGAELDWREAERSAEAAAASLVDKIRESNGSLDVHDEKGRAAAAAVDELAEAAADAAQAKYNETQNVSEANRVYQEYINRLHDILIQAGMSETEVQNLINTIAKMPTYKSVTIDAKVRLKMSDLGYGVLAQAQGGITKAADGLMTRPGAGISKNAILWAEAGEEAYIARNAPHARSLAIANQAASWHGGMVVPRGWQGGGAATRSIVDVRLSWLPGSEGVVTRGIRDGMRADVTTRGGSNVQGYYGRRGRP